ncbi:MAG TPA: Sec-independent protein translocase protein TatB [Gallionella sp.]|nr:Sec-independent protein translocase protein TatB [Gallionella sp.]
MFDFSLPELMVVLVVALIVIGPERLPKVARTLGHLYGRAQRYVNGVKADIARDMAIEEFRQLQQKVQEEASAAERSVRLVEQALDQQVQQINRAVAQAPAQQAIQPAIEPPQAASVEASTVTSTKS